MKKTLLAATAALLMAGPGLASATPNSTSIAKVPHGDLDLGRADGRAAFDARLRAAARRVCSDPGADPLGRLSVSRCERDSLAQARNAATAAVSRATQRVQLAGSARAGNEGTVTVTVPSSNFGSSPGSASEFGRNPQQFA